MTVQPGPVRGRLAPSPTGYLHLGNIWAFLWAWLACRSCHGQMVLRIEDIDPDRSKNEYVEALLRDLRWLGLDWDEGPDMGGEFGPYFQSQRYRLYDEVLSQLAQAGHVYPCYCTRKELRTLAGAPHPGDMGAAYPGTCRSLSESERKRLEAQGRRASLRLRCPSGVLSFEDGLYGPQSCRLEDCGGDFALRRSDGVVAYQLAVVVDDGRMGITHVVRGEDLLVSTPRQLALFDMLAFPRPSFMHIPLLCDTYGERLAKRHNSLSVAALRDAGVSASALVGYLGWKARLLPESRLVAPQDLIPYFMESGGRCPKDPLYLEPDPVVVLKGIR